jgi:formiminotetrahydrofolate cyclodeaminase
MEYINKSIKNYLIKLAAKKPVPGGGSTAALIGALGCGLVSMVANFTLSDKGFNGYKPRAKKVLKKSEHLREKLTRLVDMDIKAYEKLSAAMRKYNPDSIKLQSAVKGAIITPCRICDCAHRAAAIALEASYIGKKNILSDIIAAIHALDTAFEIGFINIMVNLKYLKDKKYAAEKNQKYLSLQIDMKNLKTQILSKAVERMNK